MAAVQGQINETVGQEIFDIRRSSVANNVKNTSVLATPGDYSSRNAIEAKLLTQGYTQAALNLLSMNDLIYACRVKNDSAGIG